MVFIAATTFAAFYPILAGSALLMALIIGVRTQFDTLTITHCETAEYWPSVSSTIGDVLAGRVIWRVSVVFSIIPRLIASYFMFEQFSALSKPNGHRPSAAKVMWLFDLVRIGSGIGWTMVSSQESVGIHHLCFGIYMGAGFALHILQTYLAKKAVDTHSNGMLSFRLKAGLLASETTCALLVVKFFIDHVTYCSAGLYSRATMTEWVFCALNLAFDASQGLDLGNKGIHIGDADGRERSVVSTPFASSSWIQWSVDVFFGFQLWGMIIQLYQAVYFIPMVAMQFTPEVAIVFVPLITLVWYIRPIQSLLQGRLLNTPTYIWLYGFSSVGYLAFDILHNPGNRIIAFGLSAGATILAYYSRMMYSTDVNPDDTSRIALSLPVGCVVSMCLRMLHTGLDPLHTDAVYNIFGFAGCLLATYFMKQHAKHAAVSNAQLPGSASPPSNFSPVAAGAAFGTISALSLALATNGGLVARYIALPPFPSGILVILAFLSGLVMSNSIPKRLTTALALQVCGFFVFNFATTQSNRFFENRNSPTRPTGYSTDIKAIDINNWSPEAIQGSNTLAFAGALAMLFGLGACWPIVSEYCLIPYRMHIASRKPKSSVPRSFELVAAMSQLLTLMMHVYVVCFPFVPGGFLLRDRIQLPFVISFVVLGACLYKCSPAGRVPHLNQLPVLVVGSLIFLMGGCSVLRVALAPPAMEVDGPNPLTAKLTALIWTIHFGMDDFGVDSTHRLVEMVKKEQPGVVGILESDIARIMNGNRDVMEALGYYIGLPNEDYGPTTFDGTFGCALVTKYPIKYVRRYAMPSPVGEIACLIHAKIEVSGELVNIFVGHWGNTEHVPDRILQSQLLGSLARANPGPSVFLGYLTTNPDDTSSSASYLPLYSAFKTPQIANGRFRDTAYTMWKERKWVRTDTDGYVGTETEAGVAPEDVDHLRPPLGAKPRSFLFTETNITVDSHPRLEYRDRYCQYILYKTGHPSEEATPSTSKVVMKLHHWYRVLDVKQLSDTEIQVAQFEFNANV